jgi:hypothetical protein
MSNTYQSFVDEILKTTPQGQAPETGDAKQETQTQTQETQTQTQETQTQTDLKSVV